jgi:hypothetical protein
MLSSEFLMAVVVAVVVGLAVPFPILWLQRWYARKRGRRY